MNFSLSRAQVTYDPEQVNVSDLVSIVKKVGYDVGVAEMRVRISRGLLCVSCVGFIEGALNSLPGVLAATINPTTDTALIHYVPKSASFKALVLAKWSNTVSSDR